MTDRQTDGRIFAFLELLFHLKNTDLCTEQYSSEVDKYEVEDRVCVGGSNYCDEVGDPK